MSLLKNLGLKGSWGLRVPPNRVDAVPSKSMMLDPLAGMVSRDWLDGFRPGDKAQEIGCCVGRGSMNLAEVLIQLHNPGALKTGENLDGDALYWWIRNHYYHDQNPDGGAQIEEGVRALVEAGVLPPDTTCQKVQTEQADINEALKDGPVLQGHMVDEAWQKPASDGKIPDEVGAYLGGHCTLLLGQWYFKDSEAEYVSGNSWGDEFGYHGMLWMGWTRWKKTCVDTWRVVVSPSSIKTWDGYRRWIIGGVKI